MYHKDKFFISSSVVNLFFGLVFRLMACTCVYTSPRLAVRFPDFDCVGGMVLLVLAVKASLTLSFYCEMDNKL